MSSVPWMNQTEFGRYIGVTRQAVKKAIDTGRIPKNLVNKEGKLHAQKAKIEYFRNSDPQSSQSAQKNGSSSVKSDSSDGSMIDLKKNMLKIDTLSKKHKLGVQIGKYVEKEQVNAIMFSAGREIRDSFLKLPDKYIDDIISVADVREEARLALLLAIENTLKEMATTMEYSLRNVKNISENNESTE